MACKEGQFDVVKSFFSINLNVQPVNGMTLFWPKTIEKLIFDVRLLDTTL